MRTIKFRAWDKRKKIMVNPIRIDFPIEEDSCIFWENDATWEYAEHMELMQFTGLLDRSGKEIYEGDIVRTENEDVSLSEQNWEGTVTYQHCMYVIVQPDDSYTPAVCNHKIVSLEVIGNVYEKNE